MLILPCKWKIHLIRPEYYANTILYYNNNVNRDYGL